MSSATAMAGCVSFIWTAKSCDEVRADVTALPGRTPECAAQRAGHEEVLLFQVPTAAVKAFVTGVQDLGDSLPVTRFEPRLREKIAGVKACPD